MAIQNINSISLTTKPQGFDPKTEKYTAEQVNYESKFDPSDDVKFLDEFIRVAEEYNTENKDKQNIPEAAQGFALNMPTLDYLRLRGIKIQ